MALKLCKRDNRYLAKLVTENRAPCAFCLREVDDEVTFGKLYAIGDIQCHYFCCLLSCCLVQKGHDEEGLFGFLYTDILAEIERCKKHKCSYCNRNGANLGCSVGVCRKQFHLPCGREKNAISLYYGSYKSFCQQHAPKQKIPEHIMEKARHRKKLNRMKINNVEPSSEEMVCVICYEAVDGFPTIHTFWPPCCAKDAWFHRTCVQRMSLSAGMHYLKCPLCNDKENFFDAVVSQGYYVPDRDAAWELEQNAFSEIYERPASCSAEICLCPSGRGHDAENGKWDIKLCLLCGSAGAHAQCIADQSQHLNRNTFNQSQAELKTPDHSPLKTEDKLDQLQKATASDESLNQLQKDMNSEKLTLDQSQNTAANDLSLDQSQKATDSEAMTLSQSQGATDSDDLPLSQSNALSLRYVCQSCLPAAPEDLSALASSIEAIIQQEQLETVSNVRRPIMPSRMSLRRTKVRAPVSNLPSSSRPRNLTTTGNESSDSPNTRSSRLDLNLKTPRRLFTESIQRDVRDSESKMMSPVKLLEQSFREKVVCTGVRDAVLDESIIETLRRKFRKPRPLCEKKRIVNDILDGIFDNLMKNTPKQKEQIIVWCSPKKNYNTFNESEEIPTENNIKESSKTPKKDCDKENYSNSTNTPTKCTKILDKEDCPTIINTDVISKNDVKETDAKVKKAVNLTENCQKLPEINKVNNKSNEKLIEMVDDTPFNTVKENCRSTRSSVLIINDLNKNNEMCDKNIICAQIQKEKLTTPTRKGSCRITRLSESKTVDNEGKNGDNCQIEKEIDDTPKKIAKRHCRNTRKSTSRSLIDVEDSNILNTPVNVTNTYKKKTSPKLKSPNTYKNETSGPNLKSSLNIKFKTSTTGETPTKNAKRHCRNTRNSLVNVEDSNTPNTPANNTFGNDQTSNLIKISPLKIMFYTKTSKKQNTKTCNDVQIINNEDNISPKLKKEDEKRAKSESFAGKECQKQDSNLLRKLLTDKDLCSQLLRELTTGKRSDKYSDNEHPKSLEMPVTLKGLLETANSVKETPKSLIACAKNVIQSSENLIDLKSDVTMSPIDLIESPVNLINSPINLIESPTEFVESPINLIESPTDLTKSSPNLAKTLTDLVKSPTDLVKSPTDLVKSPTDLVKSRTDLVESPTDLINFETAKRKTIDIQQDSSLEISENDQTINIDVIKIEESSANRDAFKDLKINIPDKTKVCAFKFSPLDKETLEKNNVGIDLESFKKGYLSEVDREFTCSFRHKHVDASCKGPKLRTAIDFAIDAAMKKETGNKTPGKNHKKRKLSENGERLFLDSNNAKKRKVSESDLQLSYEFGENKIEDAIIDKITDGDNKVETRADKVKRRKKTKDRRKAKKNKKVVNKNIEVTIDSSEKRSGGKKKSQKKIKTKFAIQNENIHVRIKWKKKQLSLNIESKNQNKKTKKENHSKFKQYILQYPEGASKEVLVKPEKEIGRLKRKYVKQEKSPDKLKQTSIQNFFMLKPDK